jgi:hypothetical protein
MSDPLEHLKRMVEGIGVKDSDKVRDVVNQHSEAIRKIVRKLDRIEAQQRELIGILADLKIESHRGKE